MTPTEVIKRAFALARSPGPDMTGLGRERIVTGWVEEIVRRAVAAERDRLRPLLTWVAGRTSGSPIEHRLAALESLGLIPSAAAADAEMRANVARLAAGSPGPGQVDDDDTPLTFAGWRASQPPQFAGWDARWAEAAWEAAWDAGAAAERARLQPAFTTAPPGER